MAVLTSIDTLLPDLTKGGFPCNLLGTIFRGIPNDLHQRGDIPPNSLIIDILRNHRDQVTPRLQTLQGCQNTPRVLSFGYDSGYLGVSPGWVWEGAYSEPLHLGYPIQERNNPLQGRVDSLQRTSNPLQLSFDPVPIPRFLT